METRQPLVISNTALWAMAQFIQIEPLPLCACRSVKVDLRVTILIEETHDRLGSLVPRRVFYGLLGFLLRNSYPFCLE
jgi:hypothetical protein